MPDSYVPVIDLAADHDVVDRIGKACATSGFFIATGHGVDSRLTSDMYAASQAFFALAPEVRQRVSRDDQDPLSRGYKRNEGSHVVLETFSVNRLGEPGAPANLPQGLNDRLRTANRWPAEVTGLRDAYLSYYAAMEHVSARLMGLFALALDLPRHYFDAYCHEHLSTLTANHYPPIASPIDPHMLRQGEHRDWGTVTILLQDSAPGGLQVADARGSWHDVPAVPDSFVVNIGSLLSIWTNASWTSSVHRVQIPPPDAIDSERFSIAFFHQPNFDAVIECLPTCAPESGSPRYRPITSGRYLMGSWATNHPGS